MTGCLDLDADCARCAALCCMAPAFDKSPSFGFDKPAQTPCSNLDAAGACKIHENLAACGFSGCKSYDCHGAGQHVTQGLFGGRSWLGEPHLKERMTKSFMIMRRLHEILVMLNAAKDLPLNATERRTLTALMDEMQPAAGWSEEALSEAPIDDLARRANSFLRTLKRHVVA